jgi:hypothetical protein
MEYATKLILEYANRTVCVALRNPMALADIWAHFVARNKRPALVTLSGNVARVTF